MRLMKNTIAKQYSNTQFLLASSNEDLTDTDIGEMGKNLAQEVRQYIMDYCPGSILDRISFVGFSMGGIICRAAFPYLENYKSKFYTFLSLSSPHLGYMYKSSTLFDTGMWFLKKWKKSKSLA